MASTSSNRLSVPAEMNDSSSEYSLHEAAEAFGSDIDDEEQDGVNEGGEDGSLYDAVEEEEEVPYTRADVMKWTPAEVSAYLQSRQISPGLCMKFEEGEVSGSILLQLEMAHLKELDLGSFGKRFEVWKAIEHLLKGLKRPLSKPRSGSNASNRHSVVGPINETGYNRNRGSTSGTVLPRIRSQHNRPLSRQHQIDILEANSYRNPAPRTPATATTISSEVWERPRSAPRSPAKRPSTYESTTTNATISSGRSEANDCRRDGSFDKSWRSGVEFALPQRSASAAEARENRPNHKITPSTGTGDSVLTGDSGFSESAHAAKRGSERNYFSSGEVVSKERKLLKKNSRHHTHGRVKRS